MLILLIITFFQFFSFNFLIFFKGLLENLDFYDTKSLKEDIVVSMVNTLEKLLDDNSLLNLSSIEGDTIFTGFLLKNKFESAFIKKEIKISDYEKELIYKSNLQMCRDTINLLI